MELAQTIYADFMALLMPNERLSAARQLGLALSFGRAGRIIIPTRSRTPTIAGSFVGEGQPIPVRQGAFTSQTLTPKKMAVITVWTREIDEHSIPAIEGLLRQAVQEDTAVALDSILLDTNPATTVRPAGLFNGITPITAATGGGFTALVADIKAITANILALTQGHMAFAGMADESGANKFDQADGRMRSVRFRSETRSKPVRCSASGHRQRHGAAGDCRHGRRCRLRFGRCRGATLRNFRPGNLTSGRHNSAADC